MSYLIDTCVISEFAKKDPAAPVIEWLSAQPEDSLHTSVIVFGELAKGIATMADGPRKRRLQAWSGDDLSRRFAGRVIDVTVDVARAWGRIAGDARRRGVQIGMADGLIGASALAHSLTVVTRNVSDLQETGVAVYNPWTDGAALAG